MTLANPRSIASVGIFDFSLNVLWAIELIFYTFFSIKLFSFHDNC